MFEVRARKEEVGWRGIHNDKEAQQLIPVDFVSLSICRHIPQLSLGMCVFLCRINSQHEFFLGSWKHQKRQMVLRILQSGGL